MNKLIISIGLFLTLTGLACSTDGSNERLL